MFSVIFEVCPAQGQRDAYLGHARALRPELEGIDGFLDNERFASRTRPGWVLSHSTWRDEKAVIRWRTHAGHHLVQGRGRAEVFADYRLRVGEVTADENLPPGALPQQRFDATEAGAAKACTLTVWEGAPGPDPEAPGLIAQDLFESLTTPGRLMRLCGWTDAEAAGACRPEGAAGHRTVRVIRDYALRDRREAPQYFPDAPPAQVRP
ncbi:antibiotic biosynthesis monooxygenase [Methylobacterium sp. NEAU 140]|uniref:antibiotic biosynthesis monooxygenase family protein n=1 Tax=Methylobacterium sp. NEAU 140 TaxID=3064945 RepID=UPI002734DE7C|nr:antibiotic biosynthesis monooxygenase [Methylobacterium sp. NEAU 140]MDP4022832.1 antibiotic biosynthesis monooxygenase [Methylobacterium sp. NEAU 140]